MGEAKLGFFECLQFGLLKLLDVVKYSMYLALGACGVEMAAMAEVWMVRLVTTC